MASSSKPMTRNKRVEWSLPRERVLLQILVDLKRSGSWRDTGPRRENWRMIVDQMNQKFPSIATSRVQIKNHLFELKKNYRIVKAIRESRGFEWDESMQQAVASDTTWEEYIMEHRDAKKFRNTSFPVYDDLDELYQGTGAEVTQSISTMPVEQNEDTVFCIPSHPLMVDDMSNRSNSGNSADVNQIESDSTPITSRENREDFDQDKYLSGRQSNMPVEQNDNVPYVPSQLLMVDDMGRSDSGDSADVNQIESESMPTPRENQEDFDPDMCRSGRESISTLHVKQNEGNVPFIASQPLVVDDMHRSHTSNGADVNQIESESTPITPRENQDDCDQDKHRSGRQSISTIPAKQNNNNIPCIPSQPLMLDDTNSDSSDGADMNQIESESTPIPLRENREYFDRDKRRSGTTTSVPTKRSRTSIGVLADELSRLVDMRSAAKPSAPNLHGYEACMDEIISMEEFTIEERIKLSDILRDELYRIAFMKFSGVQRIAWARAKLRERWIG